MFELVALQTEIRVPPSNLALALPEALAIEINQRFRDRILRDMGLCVKLHDITSYDGGYVYPGVGSPSYTVGFHLIFFRPFVGEILIGKITSCDKNGLKVSMAFFEDIYIPEHQLPEPSRFDDAEKIWIWRYEDNNLFLELEEKIRFRVEEVKFPPLPTDQEKDAKPFAPMVITGSIRLPGLGSVQWW